MGAVKRNAIALNASKRLASNLQGLLKQNAATPLKEVLRMGVLLFQGSESGEHSSPSGRPTGFRARLQDHSTIADQRFPSVLRITSDGDSALGNVWNASFD
jgi:hypothetical protein